jgi:hypothetical protein
MAMATVSRFGADSRARFNRKLASGWSAQSAITLEKARVFPFSMAVKMSEQTSARIPVLSQAAVIAAFVSELFENNRAQKAIAATAYRYFRHRDR